jgi:hypothetical protein
MLHFSCFWKALPLTGLIFASLIAHARGEETTREADERFREGRFAEASGLYTKLREHDPKNHEATLKLGTLALLGNDLKAAEPLLLQASALKQDDPTARKELAVLYYRRDDFAKAAAIYHALGVEVLAKKLESFQGHTPYLIEGKNDVATIPFVHTDPLPLIQVKVKNETVNFLIDTGAAEVYLDPEFAKKVGAVEFGSTTGVYGGGLQANTGQGKVDEVTLGEFVIRNVPVNILSTRRFAAAARGKRVDGVLGTVLLSHFLTTLDYPKGRLILRRRTREQVDKLDAQTLVANGVEIPFWLAGQHFMLANGRVNKSKPMLFFADTGLAGGGFICPKSTLKDGDITLPNESGIEGLGGGGALKAIPFKVDELSFGPVTRRDVQAFAGVFPETMEYREGFRIGGFISHQFFRPFALTIDFSRMRFVLVKGDERP